MAKAKPKAGQSYTIVSGDTLWDIANAVYGAGSKYRIIWDANKSNLRSGDPNRIYPGELLWIPEDPDRIEDVPTRDDEGSRDIKPDSPLSIYINGDKYNPVKATVIRTFDTCSDGWTATFRDDINDKGWTDYRSVFRPYSYTPAEVFIDTKSTGKSFIYNVTLKGDSTSGEVSVEGFSPSIDIVDSVAEPPYEENNITLEAWTRKLIKPFGLTYSTKEADQTAWSQVNAKKVKRIKIGREEKVFAHLSEKYRQKGFVLSNSLEANLSVRSAPQYKSVEQIAEEFVDDAEEDATPVWEFNSSFKGRDRYRVTLATGKGRLKNFKDRYVDPAIPRNRRTIFNLSSSEESDMSTAAKSRARKAIEDALTVTVPVRGWYSRDGKLYEPGQFVLYKSRRLFLEKGVVLMIRKVVYVQNGEERKANLDLIPPAVYSQDEEVDDPWNSDE
jgi:prophage tail gpP-like protein